MNTDIELEVWREQWQVDPVVPPNLRRSVERQSSLMRIGLIGDCVVTVVMGGGTTLWAVRSPGTGMGLVAAATWCFLAVAWIFALVSKRGLWAPSALDTASFVDLSIRRCRVALATTWFGAGLFVAEVAFGLGWIYKHSSPTAQTFLSWLWFSSLRIDIVWILHCGILQRDRLVSTKKEDGVNQPAHCSQRDNADVGETAACASGAKSSQRREKPETQSTQRRPQRTLSKSLRCLSLRPLRPSSALSAV